VIQVELLEPSGPEVVQFAQNHLSRSIKAERLAATFDARGASSMASMVRRDAEAHFQQFETLETLANFESLAGLIG